MKKLSAREGMERTREKSGAQESKLKIRALLQSQQGTVALNRKVTEKIQWRIPSVGGKKG